MCLDKIKVFVLLGYLKNLTSQALPGLSLVKVEAQFFSRILPKVSHFLLKTFMLA